MPAVFAHALALGRIILRVRRQRNKNLKFYFNYSTLSLPQKALLSLKK
jgi:hypothetical protein